MTFEEYHRQQEELRRSSQPQPLIDVAAAEAAKAEKEEKAKAAFREWLGQIGEQKREEQDRLNYIMLQGHEKKMQEKKAEMEAEIAAETAAAKKEIKARYAKEYGAQEWNESPYEAGLRKLAQMLHK